MPTQIRFTNGKILSTEMERRKKKQFQVKILLYIVGSLFILALTGAAVMYILEHRKAFLSNTPYEEKDGEVKMIHLNLTANNTSDYLTDAADNITFPVPGTKWCGGGRIAVTDDGLGTFTETEKCCHSHENCPDYLNEGETKYGLHNTGIYMLSHCDCDHVFYQCLKDVNSLVSDMVGFGYFTLFGPKCFMQEYPYSGCRRQEITNYALKEEDQMRCVEYEFNKNISKVYQFFDNALYF